MTFDSAQLADWLSRVLAEDDASDSSGKKATGIWYFPTNEVRDEYISTIDSRPEDQVRRVIERMLIPRGSFGSDRLNLDVYQQMRKRKDLDENSSETLRLFQQSEYMRRVVDWYSGASDEPPRPGIKWVLRLLPDRPRAALNALEAFFLAYIENLSDGMISALDDAESVIRARYIGVPESTAERLQALHDLTSREFEQLVEHLYAEMGYETKLTPPSSDGGRDIIASSSVAGRREHLLVECKQYHGKVRIEIVRALLGVVGTELANKGALVTTADFTRGARKLETIDHRIELVSGSQLVLLLNEYLGNTWPTRVEYLTRERPFRVEERAQENKLRIWTALGPWPSLR